MLRKKTVRGSEKSLVSVKAIGARIFVLRGHRVMLDRDLAALFGVETRTLNQAAKRNIERFPDEFMFRLTMGESRRVLDSRSQIVILKRGANVKYAPYVFTEHGVVMLANVLKSRVAIRASIQVVKAFVRLRRTLAGHTELGLKVAALERKVGKHDSDLQSILQLLRSLVDEPSDPPKRTFGFRT